MRNRIRFEESAETQNAVGATTTWSTFATVWAAISPLSGAEYYTAMQSLSETTHRVTTRYIAGVNTHMRIVSGDREFNIVAIINVDNRNRELDIMCKEVPGAYHDNRGA